MVHSTKIHTRAGSRTSLVSVGQMPVIKEDSIIAPAPVMLHIPSKNPRRSLGPQPQGIIIPYIAGFQDLPPEMLAVAECDKTQGADGDEKTVVGQMTPPPTATPRKKRRWNGEEWTPSESQRKCHLVIVSSVVLVIIAGIATGLTLGLTKT
ncbi:hypothetical protein HDV63DRAFT_411428 [Trichoderma sp. SZMC 28014]